MFRKLIFISILLIQLASCSKSDSFKSIHCFLSGAEIDLKAKVNYCGDAIDDLSELDYSIKSIQIEDFRLTKVKNGEYLLFPKYILEKFRKESTIKAIDVNYVAENEKYYLYLKRERFLSRRYGEVGLIKSFADFDKSFSFDGQFINGKILGTKSKVKYPIANKINLNPIVGQNGVAECLIKVKSEENDKSIYLVNSIESKDNVSIYYKRDLLPLVDSTKWNSHYIYLNKPNFFIKKDIQKLYILNYQNISLKFKTFNVNVFDPFGGDSKFYGNSISSFVWGYSMNDQKWQKITSYLSKDRLRCQAIKPGKTGGHFSSELAKKPLLRGDEFAVDFQYQYENESDSIFLIIEIVNNEEELMKQEKRLVGASDIWKMKSVVFKLPEDIKASDRVLFYFKNESKTDFFLTDLCAAVNRKNIICN